MKPFRVNFSVIKIEDVRKIGSSIEINKIYENPDELAEFPEGLNAFRVKLMDAISSNFVKTGKADFNVETTISFIVEKDGTFTNIKASGENIRFNKATVKALKIVKGKWKPAKYNDEVVRSLNKIPISLSYEEGTDVIMFLN